MTRELFSLLNFLLTQCYVWCDVVCSHSRLANKIIQQKSPIEYRGFILISEFWAIHSSLSYMLATLLYKSVSQLSSGILTRRMEGKWRTLSLAEGNFAKEKRCRESEQLHKQHRKVQSMRNYWVCSLKKAICFAWISLSRSYIFTYNRRHGRAVEGMLPSGNFCMQHTGELRQWKRFNI